MGKAVRFPFGFGLSYTTFAYSDLSVSRREVSFTLANTGRRPGAEIAQVYISAVDSGLFRPALELKGFCKTALRPGERRRVTIPLDDKAFRYFNVKTDAWEVEGGVYRVLVGASVRDIRLSASLRVQGTGAPLPYDPRELPSYFSGHVEAVGDREFERLLGRPLPPSSWDPSAPLEWNDALIRMTCAKSAPARALGRHLERRMRRCLEGRSRNLNVLFICNMPFRGLARMTGGMITARTARSLLLMVNGHFFSGLAGVVRGLLDGRRLKRDRKHGI